MKRSYSLRTPLVAKWVLERLWVANAPGAFEAPNMKEGLLFDLTNMNKFATTVAERLVNGLQLSLDSCHVPGFTKKGDSLRMLLANLSRGFNAGRPIPVAVPGLAKAA